MTQIDAGGILDIAMAGTSATLLARKWESALLVNVGKLRQAAYWPRLCPQATAIRWRNNLSTSVSTYFGY
jgi:hypothetical protein